MATTLNQSGGRKKLYIQKDVIFEEVEYSLFQNQTMTKLNW